MSKTLLDSLCQNGSFRLSDCGRGCRAGPWTMFHESAAGDSVVCNNKPRIPTRDQHLVQSFLSQYLRAMGAKQSSLGPAPAPAPVTAPSPRVPNVQFRVLIIGRANAGKTSILQRVCDTTESPEVYRSGPSGVREQVRAHSRWLFQSHGLSRLNSTPL